MRIMKRSSSQGGTVQGTVPKSAPFPQARGSMLPCRMELHAGGGVGLEKISRHPPIDDFSRQTLGVGTVPGPSRVY